MGCVAGWRGDTDRRPRDQTVEHERQDRSEWDGSFTWEADGPIPLDRVAVIRVRETEIMWAHRKVKKKPGGICLRVLFHS